MMASSAVMIVRLVIGPVGGETALPAAARQAAACADGLERARHRRSHREGFGVKRMISVRAAMLAGAFALAACNQHDASAVPGDIEDSQPFGAIAEGEVVYFSGTEPFWGGQVAGQRLTWSTPENIEGSVIDVERFAGRGGLSFSGALDEAPLDMTVTPGTCSDGMSDYAYPFTVTVQLGGETREGCGWSDAQPRSGGG